MLKTLTISLALAVATPMATLAFELPQRDAVRPQTTDGVPHVQLGVAGDQELSDALLARVATFPGVTLGATRVSLPGAVGFQLDPELPLAQPQSVVGGLEFAHLHPDGSLHASLEPELAKEAIEAGWAIAHPWANQRAGWSGFVMIYSPLNQDELYIVTLLVEKSYEYITGNPSPT